MADIIDVQNELVAVAAQTLYPSGTGQPSLVIAPVKIYPGWPTAATLDADLPAGTCHVTVFPVPGMERNTTRYPQAWQDQTVTAQTLTLTVSGQTVTVGGTVSTPQNVMLMVGGQPYVYPVQATDTLIGIATGLSSLVPGASNVGAVITLPATAVIDAARVGTGGVSIREIRRQSRVVKLSVWAGTPALRDAIAIAIDSALAPMEFLTLADQFAARLIYHATGVVDDQQKAGLYRRDLDYLIEYATTQTTVSTQVTQEVLSVAVENALTTVTNL